MWKVGKVVISTFSISLFSPFPTWPMNFSLSKKNYTEYISFQTRSLLDGLRLLWFLSPICFYGRPHLTGTLMHSRTCEGAMKSPSTEGTHNGKDTAICGKYLSSHPVRDVYLGEKKRQIFILQINVNTISRSAVPPLIWKS